MTANENFDTPQAVAAVIDHTLLKPEATERDIARLCREAREFSFFSVCINPCWVRFAAKSLAGSNVRVCTVVGFPLGANNSRTKMAEAEIALDHGAHELDIVQNIGALRSGDFQLVEKELTDVAALAHSLGGMLKVILETSLLNEEEKIAGCRLAVDAHADFVKTSTGFSTGGASVDDVKLMRRTVPASTGVKASAGIRSLDTLRQMLHAGANRIGTSSGLSILQEVAGTQPAAAPSASAPVPLSAAKIPGGDPQAY